MQYKIMAADEQAKREARRHIDRLVKPVGSLGTLEDWAVQLCGVTGRLKNEIKMLGHTVFAADNGVVEAGVTPVPQSVTAQQFQNMAKGLAGINALLNQVPHKVLFADVGMAHTVEADNVKQMRVCAGTRNIAQRPAMSCEQAADAMEKGAQCAQMLCDQGCEALSAGDMGIGNTTTSAAVIAAITGKDAAEVTGRGTGIADAMLRHKIRVVRQALRANMPDARDALDVLHKVGGLDIAAMAGFYLRAAELKRPILLDGVISMAAALIACGLHQCVRDYLFASHRSTEPGYDVAAQALNLKPVLHLDMRLGEGTGCPMAFFLLKCAAAIMIEMGTLEQGGIPEEAVLNNTGADT